MRGPLFHHKPHLSYSRVQAHAVWHFIVKISMILQKRKLLGQKPDRIENGLRNGVMEIVQIFQDYYQN